jgi:hypothetical protein
VRQFLPPLENITHKPKSDIAWDDVRTILQFIKLATDQFQAKMKLRPNPYKEVIGIFHLDRFLLKLAAIPNDILVLLTELHPNRV